MTAVQQPAHHLSFSIDRILDKSSSLDTIENQAGICNSMKQNPHHLNQVSVATCQVASTNNFRHYTPNRHIRTTASSIERTDCLCSTEVGGSCGNQPVPGLHHFSMPSSLQGSLFDKSLQGPLLQNMFIENISCHGGKSFLTILMCLLTLHKSTSGT